MKIYTVTVKYIGATKNQVLSDVTIFSNEKLADKFMVDAKDDEQVLRVICPELSVDVAGDYY